MREPTIKIEPQGKRVAVWLDGVSTAYLNPRQAVAVATRLLVWAQTALAAGGEGTR